MAAHRYTCCPGQIRLSPRGAARASNARKGGNPVKHLLVRCLDVVLGCRHKRRGWPRTRLTRGNRGVFQDCLDCGKELPYRNDSLVPGSEQS